MGVALESCRLHGLKWILLVILGLLFFCPTGVAQAQTNPVLTIASQVPASPNSAVTVPITFTRNGNSITSAVFSIDYDETWLSVDQTDSDFDGIPDAIAFDFPPGFSNSAILNPANKSNEIQVVSARVSGSQVIGDNRVVMRITFGVGTPTSTTNAAVTFGNEPSLSFGASTGNAFVCCGVNGSVRIDVPTVPTIGNFVWNDSNNDGVQQDNEHGLENVHVSLYDSARFLVSSTTTSAGGIYTFAGLSDGLYVVKIDDSEFLEGGALNGLWSSPRDVADDEIDSDGSPLTHDVTVTLTAGQVDYSVDFGFYDSRKVSIGDFVWHDLNKDGVQQSGEAGLGGVRLHLYDSANVLAATTTTSASGAYAFATVNVGAYRVQVADSEFQSAGELFGWVASPRDAADDTLDSDGDLVTHDATVSVSIGQVERSLDFGFYDDRKANIGDFVWNDRDKDGIQGFNEPRLANVQVELYNSANVLVTTTTTSVGGGYSFANLEAGVYRVKIADSEFQIGGDLVGWLASVSDVSGNQFDAVDSDGNVVTHDAIVAVTNGQTNNTIDFGFYDNRKATIGDFVWNDLNQDGIQQDGEPGLANIQVNLEQIAVGHTSTTTTNAMGIYTFTNLSTGLDRVEVDISEFLVGGDLLGWNSSPRDVGLDTIDSDGAASTHDVTVAVASQVSETVDFGFYYFDNQRGSISGLVWKDDGDGILGPLETGLANTVVQMTDSSGLSVTTKSNHAGVYAFTGLLSGRYTVTVVPSGPPSDFSVLPVRIVADLADGEHLVDADFEVRKFGLGHGEEDPMIGGFVWNDLNRDGVQQNGEPGIADVHIELYDSANAPISATTSVSGHYLLFGFPPGVYRLKIHDAEFYSGGELYGWSASPRDVADDESDSDGDGLTHSVTVTIANEANLTVDFGFYAAGKSTIGNYVWFDNNRDGDQQGIEAEYLAGIDGVLVRLYLDDGDLQFEPGPNGNDGEDRLYAVRLTGDDPSTAGVVEKGWYDFNLVADGNDFWVHVAASNFAPGGPLYNLSFTNGNGAVYDAANPQLVTTQPFDIIDHNVADFGYAHSPAFALKKMLNTPSPVRVGDRVSFTIRITNTGTTAIQVLPLHDHYDTQHLFFVQAMPATDDSINDGQIEWSDLTRSLGDLPVGGSNAVVVEFVAGQDTSQLPDGETINQASVAGASADPDGDGSLPPVILPTTFAEDGVAINNPTAVMFDDLRAYWESDQIVVEWRTLTEAQLVGFDLLRQMADGSFETVNAELIVAVDSGSDRGSQYRVDDRPPPVKVVVGYRVVAQFFSGRTVNIDVALPAAMSNKVFVPWIGNR